MVSTAKETKKKIKNRIKKVGVGRWNATEFLTWGCLLERKKNQNDSSL